MRILPLKRHSSFSGTACHVPLLLLAVPRALSGAVHVSSRLLLLSLVAVLLATSAQARSIRVSVSEGWWTYTPEPVSTLSTASNENSLPDATGSQLLAANTSTLAAVSDSRGEVTVTSASAADADRSSATTSSKSRAQREAQATGSTPAADLTANLPRDLYNRALIDEVEPDLDFDYQRLNRISSLDIFPQGYSYSKGLVDKVVVYKKRHQMLLYKNNQVVRSYWIALSDRPEGDKVREGDRRTPEGVYTLDYVKENSYYYRAFHISYPNLQDIEEARRLGVRPGGMIMVHGQPPSSGEYHETVQRSDWTNGCIAILNPEIDEFISLVDPGTPIEILP